ncbi:outer membrane beta-barrel family protein [Mucilaginibacter ginkgonis]|uniref:Outer membrane beta-barrel protein n=1 Tax=Mucilaginibacter ginkgonis TaxID=2682091 RepID=A0A6I4HZA8_9SPHI|nr:outer membrane beta-barrel family protein [Mucilaginibacter ginkgonis]QQL48689.1 outer membrane beta-barrel protein [Mucilaginibacter ginkgonis]
MTKLIACIIFLCIALSSYSQSNSSAINGKITGPDNQPAISVTVRLLHLPDSAQIKAGNTDANGSFSFETIKSGRYAIVVSGIGYKKQVTGPYVVTPGQRLTIADVKLSEDRIALSEVVIRDKRDYIDTRADKTVLNVDRNILATGINALSVLATAPGVKVNSLGEIAMKAGQRPSVYVNGRQVRLQGADLSAYLQSLQSPDISQVELIQNPSARFDAGGAGGVINIIMKKGANEGFNGAVTGTAGYGSYGKAGLNANGNYRSKGVNVFGSAGIDYNKTFLTIRTDRTINDAEHSAFNTVYDNTQSTPTFNYRFGTDVTISQKHSLGFLISGNTATTDFSKSTATALRKTSADSSFITTSNLKRKVSLTNYNINYQGKLGSHQTLSADVDAAFYSRRSQEQLVTSSSITRPANAITPRLDTLNNLAPTKFDNQSFKIDYGNNLSKTNHLDAGIKGSFVHSTNMQWFNTVVNGVSVPYASLSSDFNYNERIAAAYVNFVHVADKFCYTAGLRAENLRSDANLVSRNERFIRNYNNLFPSLQLIYKPNKSQYIFDYNRRIDYLDYSIVNPIVAYQDNYNLRAGNPYLQPAIINTFQVSYLRPSVLKLSVYAIDTKNMFNFAYYSQNDVTKVLTTTKTNLQTFLSTGVSVELPVKVSKFYNFDFNGDVAYQRYKDYKGYLNKGTGDLILKLNQSFRLADGLSASVYAQYESATFYGVSSFRPNYYLNAGIAKQINPRSTLTVNATDVFNTDRDRYNINFANLNMSVYNKKETQVVRVTYTYRFGKSTVKGARRHTASNAEEQRRMNSAGL